MHIPEQQATPGAEGDYAIGASRYLSAILLVGHLCIMALVLYLDLSAVWKTAVLAVLLCSLLFELRMALRLGSKAVVKRIAAGETLQFALRDGQWHEGEVLGSTTVTSFLTVINLRVGSQRGIRSIVILPDSMAADDYRRLRVWLRWRPAAQAD